MQGKRENLRIHPVKGPPGARAFVQSPARGAWPERTSGGAGLIFIGRIQTRVHRYATMAAPLLTAASEMNDTIMAANVEAMAVLAVMNPQAVSQQKALVESLSKDFDGHLQKIPRLLDTAGVSFDLAPLSSLSQKFFITARGEGKGGFFRHPGGV